MSARGPSPPSPAATPRAAGGADPSQLDDPNPTQFVRIRSGDDLARLLAEARGGEARNVRPEPVVEAPRRLPRPTLVGWIALAAAFALGLGAALGLVAWLAPP